MTFFKNRYGEDWSKGDLARSLLEVFFMFLRGTFYMMFFKKCHSLLFVGRNTKLLFKNYITAGKNLLIEDDVEMVGKSSHGLIFGDNVSVGKGAMIKPTNLYGGEVGYGLVIGNNSNIGPYSYIGCSGKIVIGNNVMISPRVSIYAENHIFSDTNVPMKKQGVEKKYVIIEDDCWIAANSIILSGVTISEGSVVAAGSVVNRDVPPYSVVAGSPAQIIKKRIK